MVILVAFFWFFLVAAYGLLQLSYSFFGLLPPKKGGLQKANPTLRALVLVPARNEEAHIDKCLNALLAQKYPQHLFLVVVINDHSTDATVAKVQAFDSAKVVLLNLPSEVTGKKSGLSFAISQFPDYELIVCTDADCWMDCHWLSSLLQPFECRSNLKLLAAPVVFTPAPTLFQWFQALDFAGMMLITQAGVRSGLQYMANGANIAYRRSAFLAVGGFSDINKIASGDDILLMQKMALQDRNAVDFLPDVAAHVYTDPQPDLAAFCSQRIRWGSKGRHYPQAEINALLSLVWLFCVLLVVLTVAWPFFPRVGPALALGWGVKSITDFLLLSIGVAKFGQPRWLIIMLPAQIMHTIYIAVIGFWANIATTYTWKERKVK